MDRCICCGRELDYEGTLVCWACAKFGEGLTQRMESTIPDESSMQKFSLQNIERSCIMCARDYTKNL